MKKIILHLHTTLDGFAAGPQGEMDWIKLDNEMFDFVGSLTDSADTALYGRVTYEMMDSYWPTAAEQPSASKHDIQHSSWYNSVEKVVLSSTIHNTRKNKTTVINENAAAAIQKIKQQDGKNIIMFGSPTTAHFLMKHNLIDEYWLFVNPVILGKGIPVFTKLEEKLNLKLVTNKLLPCGVIALQYNLV